MPNIVCLDGYALNPGDISWEPFERLGELVVHERSARGDVAERAAGAPYLLTNKTPLDAAVIAGLPRLQYIGVLATGFNIVDVEAATDHGVVVTNVPTYGTDSVAQHVAAMMLRLVRPIAVHERSVRDGQWSVSPDWCYALTPISSLNGRTLGIVGMGRIGIAVAAIGAALGMRLVGYDVNWPATAHLGGLQVERLGLDPLFQCADVVTLHCPLTGDNHHMVDERRLSLMKEDAILINTSRGPLVDGVALACALEERRLGGAALDVLEVEPPPADDPLLGIENCVITPHIAWYARSARRRLMEAAAANLKSFQDGVRVNTVN